MLCVRIIELFIVCWFVVFLFLCRVLCEPVPVAVVLLMCVCAISCVLS